MLVVVVGGGGAVGDSSLVVCWLWSMDEVESPDDAEEALWFVFVFVIESGPLVAELVADCWLPNVW